MTQQALVAQQPFNQEQLDLIRTTVARGTSPAEFQYFIEVCRLRRLNPISREIYCIVRTSRDGTRNLTIQVSIDGFRLLAERSGKYGGQTPPEWCGPDGNWVSVWTADEPPIAARVGVIRKDFSEPVWGVARYKSYVQQSPLWTKMSDQMLSKCAESLALRKAFPSETSGLYTSDEMAQADDHTPLPTVSVQPIPPAQDEHAAVVEVPAEVVEDSTPAPAPAAKKRDTKPLPRAVPPQPVANETTRAKLNELFGLGKQLAVFTGRSGMAEYASKVLVRQVEASELLSLDEGDLAALESFLHMEEPAAEVEQAS